MKKGIGRRKILVPVVAVLLVMTAAFILISFHTFRQYEIRDLEDYSKGLTGLIAGDIIDVDDIDGYLEQGRDYPGYAETEHKLYMLREAYPDIVYLYVYQVREDGFHVVFDLNTEQFAGSEPGTVEPFFPAYRPYIPDLLAGKDVPAIESDEKYGHVLTVLTPVRDAEGTCRCYVGADSSMDMLREYTWNVISQVGLIFLIVLGIILAVSIFATDRGVIRKMDKLEDRAYLDTLTGLRNRTAYYDYNDVLNKKEEGELSFAARITEPKSGRTLECYTTEPGMQLYTANFATGYKGANGCTFPYRSAVCLEAQHFPDTPNRPYFPSVVLNPGQRYKQKTIYRFGVVE